MSKDKVSNEEPNQPSCLGAVSSRYFWLKYWFVGYIGCCIILASYFYMNIQHQKEIDKIFYKYEQDMSKLHNGY